LNILKLYFNAKKHFKISIVLKTVLRYC